MPRENPFTGDPIHKATLRRSEVPFKTGTEEHKTDEAARVRDTLTLKQVESDHVDIHDPHHVTTAEKKRTQHLATIKRQIVEENIRKSGEFPAVHVEGDSLDSENQ